MNPFILSCKCETHRRLEGHKGPTFQYGSEIDQRLDDWERINMTFSRHYKLAGNVADA